MNKILLSLLTITLVSLVAVGATKAYFSDTETSTGNSFTAGTLDLQVDGQNDPNVVHVTLSNMKPGQTASYSWTLSNVGSLSGKPWIEITNLKNYDNDCNDSETAALDTTCGIPGLGNGELGQYLYMQINAAGSGGYVYPNNPVCINGRQCPINYWAGYGAIGQGSWETISPSSSIAPMVLEFEIPSTTGNIIQSDSVEFDVVFHLEQV